MQVMSIDPYVMTYMDEYAMLLKLKSDNSKLTKLVHDLLNIDPAKPEVLVALAVLWEKKDERGALTYAEKVKFLFFELFRLLQVLYDHYLFTINRASALMKGT